MKRFKVTLTTTTTTGDTMLPKITEKEARAFIADASNAERFPILHQTVTAWLSTKYTGSPCYNIKWNKH
jgi:hypothetical protein